MSDDSLPWDRDLCLNLIIQLGELRQAMLAREARMRAALDRVLPAHRASARNLLHYLTLRSIDLRSVQDQLLRLGLSSLGQCESHVLANLDQVLGLLHRLTGQPWQDRSAQEPAGASSSRARRQRHAVKLLGPAPKQRPVRIMVTLPTEAATDDSLVHELVAAGMDVARINCAHGDASAWRAMAARVRRAAGARQRQVKILMDLAGPKIRTGEVATQLPVLKLKPGKDLLGRVSRPARLGLRPIGANVDLPGVDASVGVWEVWLERLKVGSHIEFHDARGAKRHLRVVQRDARGAIAESLQTAYLTSETLLVTGSDSGKKRHSTLVCQIENQPGTLRLRCGDKLRVTRDGLGQDIGLDGDHELAQIACTLPQVIDQVKVGERIWFDDGRIGGVICETRPDAMVVGITHAREGGGKLGADQGIKLPDSALDLPALTAQDLEDLRVVAAEADLVGLSFVHQCADVHLLRQQLQQLGREDMGMVLRIESRRGFENLPELLLASMCYPVTGIMIARGDLAVECGYERLAEVQQEILGCAEAAHLPVIWPTQVLASLDKDDLPSRADMPDAGLGVRAECVLLNQGPYIVDAVRTLDDILTRMGGHQARKRPFLRGLRAWDDPGSSPDKPQAC